MAGDILRVVTSVAMMTALSQGRTRIYAGIELFATAVFVVTAFVMIRDHAPAAPWVGYIVSHALVGAGAIVWLLRRSRLRQ